MKTVLFILYMAVSYWAVGRTIYANKIQVGELKSIFIGRLILGVLFGWILIPIAIIKTLLGK